MRYVEQLQRYRAALPAEQMLVLIYDDFRRDNEGTVRSVLRFLEVNDAIAISPLDANPTRQRMRSQLIDEVVNMVSVGRGLPARAAKAGIKTLTTDQLRSNALRVTRRRVIHGEPEPADEKLARELRARFKDEVVALSEYLDRDLVEASGVMASVADAPASDRRPPSACLAQWRETMAERQMAALPDGSVTVSCSAAPGKGGLGRHLDELVAAVERGGRQSFRISGSDRAQGLHPPAIGARRHRSPAPGRAARRGLRCRLPQGSARLPTASTSIATPLLACRPPSTSSRSTARR